MNSSCLSTFIFPSSSTKQDGNEVDCAVLTEKDHKRMEELSKGNDRKEYHVIEVRKSHTCTYCLLTSLIYTHTVCKTFEAAIVQKSYVL